RKARRRVRLMQSEMDFQKKAESALEELFPLLGRAAEQYGFDVDLESGQVLDQFALITPSGKSPAFSRRTVTTRLTLKHEETAVLSGVIDTSFTESNRGVPGLMKIPIIGNLFKSRGKSTSKTELLTFITPYILADQNDRLAVFDRHKARIERYEKFRNIMKEVDVRAGVSP
ncbi:MAG TPA: hypothetical protein PK878_20455, partial [bacterium]|nr:hypothetical protein [bacterium]